MVRLGAACLLMVACAASLSSAQSPHPLASFSIVLERNGARWSAQCDSGCAFQGRVSTTTRVIGTPMRMDEHGLRTLATEYSAPSAFAFTLVSRGQGWEATSEKGTAWTALAFDCAGGPCRARITEMGVSAIGSGR